MAGRSPATAMAGQSYEQLEQRGRRSSSGKKGHGATSCGEEENERGTTGHGEE
jgi:hypothetical protein